MTDQTRELIFKLRKRALLFQKRNEEAERARAAGKEPETKIGWRLRVWPEEILSILPEVNEQRGDGYCGRCGGPNIVWAAPSPLWNHVMRGGDINAADAFTGIVCPICFAQLAEDIGAASGWRLVPMDVLVELPTTTPSGRVWNEETWLWEAPND